MSLELAIQENTAALKALLAVITSPAALANFKETNIETKVYDDGTQATGPGPLPEDSPVEKKTKPAKQETKVEDVKAEAVAPEEQAIATTYDDVKEAVTNLVKKHGRDKGLALLAEFGVTSATALKPEQYAEAVEKFKGAL